MGGFSLNNQNIKRWVKSLQVSESSSRFLKSKIALRFFIGHSCIWSPNEGATDDAQRIAR